jgi:hypothetical protein
LLSATAPDGFCVNSFAGDSIPDCRDYVKAAALGIGEWQRPNTPYVKPPRKVAKSAPPSNRALSIWHEAGDIRGSPAWTYLERRGVAQGLPSTVHHALRWHPRCPWKSGVHGCMIALFTDALTGAPRAIHRTAITPDGTKVDRLALDPIAGCLIRLWPVATHRLVSEVGRTMAGQRDQCDQEAARPVWSHRSYRFCIVALGARARVRSLLIHCCIRFSFVY